MSLTTAMKIPKSIALFVCVCALLTACSKPDYHTADGASGRFIDLRGKWLVISYWAEWCKPCIEEMPELNQFGAKFASTATVFAVNYDNAQDDKLQQQIKKLHIELPVLLQDPAVQLGYQRPEALPTTFIFNPEGELKATLVGPQTGASLAAAMGQPVAVP
ncbi:MAG: thioredoxin [Verrucomicrobiaceae bacterium]|nr:thioredoxin [Verrucomicrobiaceae bacterium]